MKTFDDLKTQWSGQPPPDPSGALKLIWDSGILSELQKEFIVALMSQPQGAAPQAMPGAPQDPMGAPPGPMGAPPAPNSGI